MRRLFWLTMGITIGVLVVRKMSQAAEKLTPQSIAGQLADGLRDLGDAIADFGADVRAAAASREDELRSGTGLDAPLPTRDEASAGGQAALAARRGAHSADS
ncbi:hypothetical protein [Modestobacter sp. Leaf380]|uniref:hypothetical protein n=1 Tax=Modestobacter sp. Leaf380 TaxID=1736356 RepID=UPI000702335A|nr:hypothetical protein [Modestobacter sp. Leaf380]KQS64946.1 hypothetical protein ASG41_16050 [Modestobacter sp. Leaf380]